MRKIDWLIFGATFLGCSFAQKIQNCVILEEKCTLCKEFIENFNEKTPKIFIPQTKDGKAFHDTLKKQKLVSESGAIYGLPALFEFAKPLSLNTLFEIHFDTVVTSINKEQDGFIVEYSNCDGLQKIFAKHILDTTSSGVLYQNTRPAYFAAVVDKNGEVKNEITGLDYIFVPFDTDFSVTREKLIEKAKALNSKILMMSNSLCYRDEVLPYEKDGIYFAPSDGFYNPLFAVEGGVLLADEL